jgi:hypothetical protein
MDDVSPALTPSMPGLFDAPTDITPYDTKEFQRINGGLVWMLPVRYDIRKEVVRMQCILMEPVSQLILSV